MKHPRTLPILVILVNLIATPALAADGAGERPRAEKEGQRAIQVHGQARHLNMMLVLRNEKDKIQFVQIRRDYKDKILEQKDN